MFISPHCTLFHVKSNLVDWYWWLGKNKASNTCKSVHNASNPGLWWIFQVKLFYTLISLHIVQIIPTGLWFRTPKKKTDESDHRMDGFILCLRGNWGKSLIVMYILIWYSSLRAEKAWRSIINSKTRKNYLATWKVNWKDYIRLKWNAMDYNFSCTFLFNANNELLLMFYECKSQCHPHFHHSDVNWMDSVPLLCFWRCMSGYYSIIQIIFW